MKGLNLLMISLILVIVNVSLYSQLAVNAGKDTVICYNGRDSLVLGDKPTAKNGVEPYRYKWTYIGYDKDHKAIEFYGKIINDTVSNPIFKGGGRDMYITFYINVTDNNQNQVRDSIFIVSSAVAYIHLIGNFPGLKKGDTCQLNPVNIFNGFPPFKYAWSPNYNLSDSTAKMPFAWPEHVTDYKVEVTDSIGCKGFDEVHVGIKPEFISKFLNKPNYLVEQDPATGSTVIKFNFNIGNAYLSIYNLKGEIVFKKQISSNIIDIGKAIPASGVYVFSLEKDNEIICKGKVLK